ncbi:hypothetical protein NESM_000891600 [Novymonas esmeraldas]|uniref:Uncharacterized protein n=1 Tax=Novymonas esmeraldas TaxID=1808958 RepID=A0AAW0F1Y2_9TRYP
MAGGGRAFSNAVAQGRVVVNRELTTALAVSEANRELVGNCLSACLHEDPAMRPQAKEGRKLTKRLLNSLGLVIEEDVE